MTIINIASKSNGSTMTTNLNCKQMQKYANFILSECIYIQPQDKLLIWCAIQIKQFAEIVAANAKMFCKVVDIYYFDSISQSNTIEKLSQYENERYKCLWLYAPTPNFSMPKLKWTLCCVPTQSWAKKVYATNNSNDNSKSSQKALSKMWDAVINFCRIPYGKQNRYTKDSWSNHIQQLCDRAKTLSDHSFANIHLFNHSGTDIKIELPINHIWTTCTIHTNQKIYATNIPTEEVFTSPLKNGVNGLVYSTKPMLYEDNIIDNFWLQFCKGKVINFDAKQGKKYLSKILQTKNGNYLGEIALVSQQNPLAKQDKFWYDTSIDENFSSHLALGNAYTSALPKDTNLTTSPQPIINKSSIHYDFMIGSNSLNAIGITKDNQPINIMQNGQFVGKFL